MSMWNGFVLYRCGLCNRVFWNDRTGRWVTVTLFPDGTVKGCDPAVCRSPRAHGDYCRVVVQQATFPVV